MTTVHVDLSDHRRTPAVGPMTWAPHRRLVGPGHVILPRSVTYGAIGAVLVPHDVTGLIGTDAPGYEGPWCYKVTEPGPGGITRYVLVPDTTQTLAYSDLVDVDPRTLEPTAAPPAAWVVALAALTARVAELEALVGDGSGTPTGGYVPDYLEAYL